jgi:hypothetical protein
MLGNGRAGGKRHHAQIARLGCGISKSRRSRPARGIGNPTDAPLPTMR